jgi:sodium/bile acid cotransporter 7
MMVKPARWIPDPFIIGLFLMIFLAWLTPGVGMGSYLPNLGMIIDGGIFLIFFLYGLKLNPERIRQGMSNWKMHLVIQGTTFLLFPLLVLPFYPLLKGTSLELFWIALFFLAALPSTVSSSVVMVSMAGGNIPGAIFNASISGMIGILVTPLWMGLFLNRTGEILGYGTILIQLLVQIILPVLLGLLLHRWLGQWVGRHLRPLARFDQTIILLIVYESFSHSFLSGMFQSVSLVVLGGLTSAVVVLFFLIWWLTGRIAHIFRFSREDTITTRFAGSKKSLVHGSVFAALLFPGTAGIGIYLLPIMIYHAFQLFYISMVARKMGQIPAS